MAKSFLTDINLNRNVLLNTKIQAWGAAPSGTGSPDGSGAAVAGQISSYLGALYIFTGSGGTPANTWVQVGNALSDSTSTTSSTVGASSTAVKSAYDLAAAALPKSGGTMTGRLILGGGTSSSAYFNLPATSPVTSGQVNGDLWNEGSGVVKFYTGSATKTIAFTDSSLTGNTSGSAGSVANTLTFGTGLTAGGASFNGSAAVTITPVSATTSVAGIVQLSDSTSTTGSTKAATETAVKAAYDRGSTGVTNAATAQTTADAALPKAGGTMSGVIAMGNNKITGLGTPTGAADAATKDYVDNVSTGINIHDAVAAATTGTIAGVYAAGSTTANPPGDGGTGVGATITYSATGVVTLDTSVTLAAGDRVLVKDGVTAASGASSIANGIYVVTTAGAVGTAAILTRASDSDNSIFGDLAAGDLVYVLGGATYGGDQFVQTTKGTATSGTGAGTVYSVKIGTDAISYTQFSGAGAVPYATDTVAGIATFPTAQFSVSTGAVSVNNLAASVITTGQLTGARGGTGVDNTGKTITLGGNLTTSGSFTTTLTVTGNTNVTLPTSGTLLTTAGSGSSLTFGTGSLSLAGNLTTSGAFATTLTATATTNATLPAGTTTLLATTGSGSSLTFGTGSLSLAGNLTTSGAFATTLTATGTTSVTLPTSGTLVNTAVATLSSLTSVGTIGTGVWQGTAVGVLYGGTGATTAAAARTNLGATTKVTLVGTGSGTTIALTHGLGTNLVTAQVYDTSTSTATLVETDITVTSTVATATFAATTTLSNYTLVVIG